MPRHNRNAKTLKNTPLSFKKICQAAGLSPKERIYMIRELKKKFKEEVR